MTPSRHWSRIDAAFLTALSLLGLALSWTVTAGASQHLVGGDAGNIAAFAAGIAAPERFAGDPVLGDPSTFKWYVNIQVYALAAARDYVAHLGTAYLSLLPPTLVLFFAGTYVLGRVVLGSPGWAAVFAALNLASFPLTAMGDFWGPQSAPIPRLAFQALWPLLMALLASAPDRPARWPVFFGVVGTLQYLHPVSAPAIAFAACCGLAFFSPPGWTRMRHLGWLTANGLLYLALATPFALIYLGSHAHGEMVNSREVLEFQRSFMGVIKTDLWAGLAMIWDDQGWTRALWIWCAATAAVMPFLRRSPAIRFLALWLVVLLVVCVGVTWGQQALARSKGIVPVEINMIRNLRYGVPVLLLMGLCGAQFLASHPRAGRIGRAAVVTLVAVTAGSWLWTYRPNTFPIRQQAECLAEGRFGCRSADYEALVATLDWLRDEAPAGSRVLPLVRDIDIPLAIRYHAFQPALYAYKDSGALGYAAPHRLDDWLQTRLAVNAILRMTDAAARCRSMVDLAGRLRADLMVVDFPVDECRELRSLDRHPPYTVLAPVRG